MLRGQLQIFVQGSDRRCRVEYVHPEDPRQRRHRDPFDPYSDGAMVHRKLLQVIEQAEAGNGWTEICTVDFDENEHGIQPRFFGFRPHGATVEEVWEQAAEPAKIVPLEVAPKPPSLGQMPMLVQQPRVNAVAMPTPGNRSGTFRNPYNFIPTPPRRFAAANPLGDHPPVGWDRLRPEFYSGWIDIELQVVTPLLTGDPETASLSDNDHRTFHQILVDAQGQPRLEPTSLRGMLSSAYEALTHSRWRVFQGHDKRLARRMPATDGLAAVPFRAERDEQGRLVARMLTGFAESLPEFDENRGRSGQWMMEGDTMLAAFIPNYGPASGRGVPVVTPDLHGRKVWARIGRVRRVPQNGNGPRFYSWVVLHWNEDRTQLSHANDQLRLPNRDLPRDIQEVQGWLCITNRNIKAKKYERLFFHESPLQYELPLQDCEGSPLNVMGQSWREVIDAYREAHTAQELWRRRKGGKRREPNEYLGDTPGATAWSGHVYRDGSRDAKRLVPEDKDWAELCEGTLGYVYLDRQGRALSLVPVHIARYPFSHSPLDQLHPSLHPASRRSELSAADRVFGWVSQNGSGSHRGQLRITDVTCQTAAAAAIQSFNPPLPLAILSTPKPKQTRFYLANDSSGTPHSGQQRDDDFCGGRSLRGIKVYPHQAGLPAGYWNVPQNRQPTLAGGQHYREYLKAGDRQQQCSNQNRSISWWVNPETRFTFRIHVTNLNRAEIGGLLWMLSRNPQTGHASGHDPNHAPVHFRYGGGKPLGFGSCVLRIQQTSLHDGTAWAEAWKSLRPAPPRDEAHQSQLTADLIKAYEAALLEAFQADDPAIVSIEQLPMVAAWLRAARGVADGTPTHYPRQHAAPQAKDENFRWFNPDGASARPVLPSILEEDRLEYQ